MKIYALNFEQQISISLAEAWDFFSSPLNLAKIIPEKMDFKITSDFENGYKMYEGMLITYKVAPILGIKLDWITEITTVKDFEYFIDEQRFGPFKIWHHEHHFKETGNGVLMTDKLIYAIPYGLIGEIAHQLMVEKQIKEIFNTREKVINTLFNS
jgi:ligand-binding SRPBCC domain-containing protein